MTSSPQARIRFLISNAFGGRLQAFVRLARLAAAAIAVFRDVEAQSVGAQVRHLAEKIDGRFSIAVFEFTIRRAHSAEDLAALPLRSPLGIWGSVLGFVGVSAALVQTWLYPRVNLISAAACIGALTAAYLVLKKKR